MKDFLDESNVMYWVLRSPDGPCRGCGGNRTCEKCGGSGGGDEGPLVCSGCNGSGDCQRCRKPEPRP